jgi:hypothetical protein
MSIRFLLAICVVGAGLGSRSASAFDCVEKYCTKMSSCAEAHHHFKVCGEAERDADNDGLVSPEPPPTTDSVPELPSPDVNEHGMSPSPPAQSDVQCGGKRRCGQMTSCEEARFYLSSCGVRSLDRDGDGVPCESLCGGRKR